MYIASRPYDMSCVRQYEQKHEYFLKIMGMHAMNTNLYEINPYSQLLMNILRILA